MKSASRCRVAAVSCALSMLGGIGANASAETIYGLTSTGDPPSLVRFDSATPGSVTTIGPLSGGPPQAAFLGMEFRPATGELYVGGAVPFPNGQTFTVDLATAALTEVGNPFDVTGFAIPSFDFNPVTDEIRNVSTNGDFTNARLGAAGGIIATDTNVSYAAGDPNAGTNPPNVIGIAHSNNFAGATSSTLFAYDLDTDDLSRIGGVGGTPSPNGGQMFTIGDSGFVTNTGEMGFDISGATGIAYISAFVDGLPGNRLFTVNLATGAMTDMGMIGMAGLSLIDISVSIPEPLSASVFLIATAVVSVQRRWRNR